jgi:hypothetical protein
MILQPDSVVPLIVRNLAMGLSGLRGSIYSSIAGVIARTTDDNTQSMGDSEAYPAREGRRPQRRTTFMSPTRYDSPVSDVECNGWCGYDHISGPIVVSILFRVAWVN